MEGHLSAIALWYRLAGTLGLASIGLLVLPTLFVDIPLRAISDAGFIRVILLIVLGACALAFAGSFLLGRYLKRYSNVARICAGALGALGLAFNVLSTLAIVIQATRGAAPAWVALFYSGNLALGSLWSGANLWALLNQRAAVICTPEYRALIARKPTERPAMYSSPFFWIPVVWVGLAILGAIVLGVLAASLAAAFAL